MVATQLLISQLKQNKIVADKLDWKQFEHVVYQLIIDQNSNFWQNPRKISKNATGEIDIIIETEKEDSGTIFLGNKEIGKKRKELHFIECKHHNKKLTLDTVARIFCAGIRHSPNNLIIISSSPLYPQAIDYAQTFFSTELGEGIFNNIFFYRTSLNSLLGKADVIRQDRKINQLNLEKKVNLEFWEIIEEETFITRSLSNSSSLNLNEIHLDTNHRNTLKIWLSGLWDSNTNISVTLTTPKGEELVNNESIKTVFFGNELKCEIELNEILNLNTLYIRIESTSNTFSFGPLGIPKFSFKNTKIINYDFREDEVSSFCKKMSLPDYPRITFISGEGGIGKSFFCEQVAKNQKPSFKPIIISINENSTEFIFYKLLWPLITPIYSGEIIPSSEDVLGIELLKTYLKKIIQEEVEDDVDSIVNNILSLSVSSIDRELLIFICSKIIVSAPNKHLIIIKDCHKLSSELIKNFNILFTTISDLGWGNISFMLEYRDNIDDKNLLWEQFVNNTITEQVKHTFKLKICSLSEKQLVQGISNIFTKTLDSDLTNILLKKTGGNPLYIVQFINYAIELGYIKKIDEDKKSVKLDIFDFKGVEKEITELPSAISTFLSKRISNYFSLQNLEDKNKLLVYIGLSSLIGYQIEEEKIKAATGISTAESLHVRSKLINDGLLKPSFTSPPAIFVHEFIQLAIKEYFKDSEPFLDSTLNLISKLSKEHVDDIILGGKLYYESNIFEDSFNWFNIGFEHSKKSGNYSQQRTCLLHLKKILDSEINNSINIEQYMNIALELGWNEYHTNSLIDAINIYHDIEYKIYNQFDIEDPIKRYFYKIETIHNLLTIYVELLWTKDAISAIKKEFQVINESERFLYCLNRIILLCARTNNPIIGTIAANICLAYKREVKPDQIWSVLYSDIGQLFLESKPEITEGLWKLGLELAEDIRQINHSKLNLLVIDLYLNKGNNYLSIVLRKKDLINQGVEGQIIRYLMYEGILALYNSDINIAKQCFKNCLKKSVLSNIKIQEWQAHNNLAIIHLLEERNEMAIQHLKKALIIVEKGNEKGLMENLEPIIIEKHKSFCNETIITSFNSPEISGSVNYLYMNIISVCKLDLKYAILFQNERENFKNKKFDDLFLNSQSSHPLFVKWKGQKLFLAID